MKKFFFALALTVAACAHRVPPPVPFSAVSPLPALCLEQVQGEWLCMDSTQHSVYICDKFGRCLKEAPERQP
jgi:hypothetical protein